MARVGTSLARMGLLVGLTACGEPFEAGTTGASCGELLNADPSLTGRSGPYSLTFAAGAGSRGTKEVYCDMGLDGGGWTLVARSAEHPAEGHFGWQRAGGSLDDFSAPYALGLDDHPVPFTEIAVGDGTPGTNAWRDHAYVMPVPADFVVAYAASSYELAPPRTVLGSCSPADDEFAWSLMLHWTGHTEQEDVFFFRDGADFNPFGLSPLGWSLASSAGYSACGRNGELDGSPGLIMVR